MANGQRFRAGWAGEHWSAWPLPFEEPAEERIITLAPFSINTQWYGILGLIGWAYLVACVVFLAFRNQRTAILGAWPC